MLAKPSVVVALLAIFACPAACGPAETNGQRMARGLPPLPPKFGRTLPGRRDSRQPTPAWGEKPKPSTTPSWPPTPYSGCLEVRDAQGHALGRVKNTNTSSTISGLSLSRDDGDLKVGFNVPQSGAPFDILATNPQFSEPYYVGAAGTSEINTLDLISRNTLAFTNVQQTPSSSIPVVSAFDSTLMVQSAIWSLDSGTSQLTGQAVQHSLFDGDLTRSGPNTAQYVNPDGSLPTTVFAYDDHAVS
ncbi:hypothetical protein DXG01_005104 [Tephrocybe rancida]|nr:hypothetical protein DXG01_005104 [Tephrocybe rancida]